MAFDESLPIKKIVMVSPGLGRFKKSKEYFWRFKKDLNFDYPEENFVWYFLAACFKVVSLFQMVFWWRLRDLVININLELKELPGGRRGLVLWGVDDLITPYQDFKDDLEKMKSLTTHVFHGGHHWFMLNKDKFFRELEGFLL